MRRVESIVVLQLPKQTPGTVPATPSPRRAVNGTGWRVTRTADLRLVGIRGALTICLDVEGKLFEVVDESWLGLADDTCPRKYNGVFQYTLVFGGHAIKCDVVRSFEGHAHHWLDIGEQEEEKESEWKQVVGHGQLAKESFRPKLVSWSFER